MTQTTLMDQNTPADSDTVAAGDVRVAVSTVIFTLRHRGDGELPYTALPLVRRTREPYKDQWALPGGWLPAGEELEHAASRTLLETTGLAPRYLEQLYAFGSLDRSPDRVISIVYWALLRSDEVDSQKAQNPHVDANPENTQWFDAAHLPTLAFDHNAIVDYALWRLRNKVSYGRIAHSFLPEFFTLAELREVHEAIENKHLDPANFRRQIEHSGVLIPTEQFRTGNHRSARLYQHKNDTTTKETSWPHS